MYEHYHYNINPSPPPPLSWYIIDTSYSDQQTESENNSHTFSWVFVMYIHKKIHPPKFSMTLNFSERIILSLSWLNSHIFKCSDKTPSPIIFHFLIGVILLLKLHFYSVKKPVMLIIQGMRGLHNAQYLYYRYLESKTISTFRK